MNDLCDGVITVGALEPWRVFEILLGSTWTSQKTNAVLNTNGFYDALPFYLRQWWRKAFKGS
jgi:hypothetical protein